MDGNHPKRRKDKYNPYTIGTTEDGRHWLTFSDGQGNRHHFEISAAVFALFDSFELDDLSYLNEVDRHYEQSELTEASLYDRAVHRPATVEESALQNMEYAPYSFPRSSPFCGDQYAQTDSRLLHRWRNFRAHIEGHRAFTWYIHKYG